MQLHELACSSLSLYAFPWTFMIFNELTRSSRSLPAVSWACMQFLSLSEQLTRISQCLQACFMKSAVFYLTKDKIKIQYSLILTADASLWHYGAAPGINTCQMSHMWWAFVTIYNRFDDAGARYVCMSIYFIVKADINQTCKNSFSKS